MGEKFELVKVDGDVYVGVRQDDAVAKAMYVGGNLQSNLDRGTVQRYFVAQNMDELVTVELGANSAVTSRGFKADEDQLFLEARFNMDNAKRFALRELENRYFTGK